jgi:O-antigen chain-terminating methyltransferase
MKRALRRVFHRFSRLLGIPEIQNRLDIVQNQLSDHRQSSEFLDPKFGALERHLEKRLNNYLIDQAAHTQQQLANQENQTQQKIEHTQQQLTDQAAHTQRLISDIHQLLNEAQAAVTASTTLHTETVTNEIRSHLEAEINKTKRDLDNIRRMASTSPVASVQSGSPVQQSPVVIDDALYISLEDHFRGDKAEVHQRQTEYIPYVSGIVSEKYPLIDLGCGRGEWLKVLQEHGISARGIDSNVACVAECKESGLDAELGELLKTLTKLPDASCGAVTMFQVLEHLPFDIVVQVLREVRRVLIDGGVFIGEVPNSETLRVGASTFWIDPTHQKPLFPAVLAFLASSVGFSGVTGKYSSPLAPTPDLTGLPENASKTILELHHAINGPGDFALIATA